MPAVLRYTGALPGRCRLSPGLKRGTTGNNRGYAETLPPFTGALPATTELWRGFTGLKRSQSGLTGHSRAVDRFQPGRHREKV
ncbi:hypothetical protein DPMN_021984 [Dreissena polymorpha]|uniref:Uncharacterized protein n=1 Tax=Dreissena polymorpha TaxID=45954 RepID=A0A9D4NPR8_DREPO|nr:hypothetical protein DPMN_021984 [Dreissena polymorpha]